MANGQRQYYDAFVCYTHDDSEFVQEMRHRLEDCHGIKLCIPARDLLAGSARETVLAHLIKERYERVSRWSEGGSRNELKWELDLDNNYLTGFSLSTSNARNAFAAFPSKNQINAQGAVTENPSMYLVWSLQISFLKVGCGNHTWSNLGKSVQPLGRLIWQLLAIIIFRVEQRCN